MNKLLAGLLTMTMLLGLCACGSIQQLSAQDAPAEETADAVPEAPQEETAQAPAVVPEGAPQQEPAQEPAQEPEPQESVTMTIAIAASLEAVFKDVIIPAYEAEHPNVTIEYTTGSSGALLTQIQEANGNGFDMFFSAGKKQVTTLDETDGLVVPGTIVNLLSNQLCLVKGNDVETSVTGWENISDAKTMALCPGSVPVGKYSRIALVSLGILEEAEDASAYSADEISAAMGGIEIDEADDVEVAASKAVEGSVEIATIYYSDYFNHQEDLTIIAQDDGTLTGAITYPVCQVRNPEATEAEAAATADFIAYLQTQPCLDAFREYCFIVNG